MKITLKKLTAWLAALLLVFQIMPVFSEEGSASNAVGPIAMYRDALEISAPNNESMLAVGKDVQLGWTDGYNNLTWTTSDEKIATVEGGLVKALSAGTVKITATEKDFSDSITFKVIGEKTEGQNPAEEKTIIMISGNKDKVTYDGQAHTVSYSVSSNKDSFNPEQVNFNGELPSYTECGTYPLELKAEDFTYADDANAEIVVNNGWLQIKPAEVIVTADNQEMIAGGPDPEYTATITGRISEEDVITAEYVVAEHTVPGEYDIIPDGETIQGNYRVRFMAGKLTVKEGLASFDLASANPVQTVTDAQGKEAALNADLDPNNAYTLNLAFSGLTEETVSAEMTYPMPENICLADGAVVTGEGVTGAYDEAANALKFRWTDAAAEAFTASVAITPDYPAANDLSGRYVLVAGNNSVVSNAAHPTLSGRLEAYAGSTVNGKLFIMSPEDPTWTLTHVTGNYYTIQSANGGFLKITPTGGNEGKASIENTDAKSAQKLLVESAGGDMLKITYAGIALNNFNNKAENGFAGWKYNNGNNEKFRLCSVSDMAVDPTVDLSGTWAVKNNDTHAFLAEDGGELKAVVSDIKPGDNKRVPQDNVSYWTFTHVKRNWYTVSTNGRYLNISAGGISMSSEAQPLLIRPDGSNYKKFVLATGDTGNDYALSLPGKNPANGFTGVANAKNGDTYLALTSPEDIHGAAQITGSWALVTPTSGHAVIAEGLRSGLVKSVAYETYADGTIFSEDRDITVWTFTPVNGGWHTVRSAAGYLSVVGDQVAVTAGESRVFIADLGNGQYRITDGKVHALDCWKENNVFIGYGAWGPSTAYGNKINETNEVHTLKSVGNAVDCKVAFQSNGGNTAAPRTIITEPGQKITLPAYAGTKNNQQMIGWSVESDYYKDSAYRKLYLVGEEFTVPEGKTTFYAVFNKQNRKAEFYIRLDGVIPDEPGDYKSDEYSSKIEIADVVKATNWVIDNNTKKNIEGNHISNDVTAKLSKLPTDEQVKAAYAAYDPDTQYILWYVVKPMGGNSNWHVDGVLLNRNVKASVTYLKNVDDATKESVNDMPGGFQLNEETLSAGQNAEGTLQTPKRPGFEFLGWNTEPDGTGTQYAAGDKINVNGDITLYARWKSTLEVTIRSNVEEQEAVLSGTEVILTAERSGSYKGAADIIWHRVDPETGEDTVIEGAKEMVYRFNINADNAKYKYYVVLEPIK